MMTVGTNAPWTLETLEERCREEIAHLRSACPDYDLLYVDAVQQGEVVARLRCQFRPPYGCGVQHGKLLNQSEQSTQWQYRFAIDESCPARVLYEFLREHQTVTFNMALDYSKQHDKFRDEQLKLQTERCAEADSITNELIECEVERAMESNDGRRRT